MQILWAPWRIKFIKTHKKMRSCVFCKKIKSRNDKKNYVVYRSQHCCVMLNLYPYTNGHVMVIPYRHLKNLSELSCEELLDLFSTVTKMTEVLKKVLKCDGVNIGLNLGKAAGAGIEGHLHVHIVPRWFGDTNFISVISETKVISQSLQETYQLLSKEVKNCDT